MLQGPLAVFALERDTTLSFWDRIKPAARPPIATDVSLTPDGRTLNLRWDDGFTTGASAQHLRQQCPCAECVDEWTNKRTLDPAKVPADLTITTVQPVGNYALAFVFADGHSTGWVSSRRWVQW